MSGVYWGPSRDSRYSGTRRGIESTRALGAPRGCRVSGGIRGCIGASKDSRYSGTRRGIWCNGGTGTPKGCKGPFGGVRGYRACQECIWG